MNPLTGFFERNMNIVFFVYGLAFFSMGLAVWLESRRALDSRLAGALAALAAFGLIHSAHEWLEMFQRSGGLGLSGSGMLALGAFRVGIMALSFLMLVVFGMRLALPAAREGRPRRGFFWGVVVLLAGLWLGSVILTMSVYKPQPAEAVAMSSLLTRYTLGVPGALLAGWAMLLARQYLRKRGMPVFGRDLLWCAIAMVLYGLIGQTFAERTALFPSTVVNAELFLQTFDVPVQILRAALAGIIAIFIIRAIRAFEIEREQHLEAANQARLAAQREALDVQQHSQQETEQLNRQLQDALRDLSRLYQELQAREAVRRELLRQVVSAQENERQRISRELHDGTGQMLTALGLGLAAASESIKSDAGLAARQLAELRTLSRDALQDLHNVITDLRPSVLYDLGLLPALRDLVREMESRTSLKTRFVVHGTRQRLDPERETIVFRIAQEALTNVAKHAQATTVSIELAFSADALQLTVTDDGQGFSTEAVLGSGQTQRHAWGLLGMQERVALVGGSCRVLSQPGLGTTIEARIPLVSQGVTDVQDHSTPRG